MSQNKREERNLNTNTKPSDVNNPCNDTFDANNSALNSIKILAGTVTKMNPGSYDAIVDTGSGTDLICMLASSVIPTLPLGLGVAESAPVAEGARVLVAQISLQTGVIICSLPAALPADTYLKKSKVCHNQLDQESGTGIRSEPAYFNSTSLTADNHRAIDVFPGDIAWFNELLVGLAVKKLTTYMQASERAKLELFLMDDEVRMTSGHYQHNSAAGEHNIFNSNGFNTSELVGSHHQCEMQGSGGYGITLDRASADQINNTEGSLRYSKDIVPYLRSRYMSHLGAVGGIFSFFVSTPAPSNQVTPIGEATVNSGLFHTSVDSSGRLLVRSAGGICLQRTDIIPTPKKTSHEWITGAGGMENKTAFKWDKLHPYARSLQLRDAFAWYTQNAYSGYRASGTHFIPEHKDVKTPADLYDTVHDIEGRWKEYGSAEFNDVSHKEASSMFHMGEDGSITIRGKCGEEITMQGGNIIISCPGSIEVRPGKSTVVMSGQDTVIKSKKSTDITSTDNDIRLKAEKNLHIYSASGGILLESDAAGDTQEYGASVNADGEPIPPLGEGVFSSGIVLKATKSRIFQWGDKLHNAFKKAFWIESLIAENTNDGIFQIVAKHLRMFATGGEAFIKAGAAALHLNNRVGRLLGQGVELVGENTANVISEGEIHKFLGKQAPVTPYNPYELIMTKNLDKLDTEAVDDVSLEESYTLVNREEIKFRFRNAEEYGTDGPIEVFGVSDKFEMCESPWVHIKKVSNIIKGSTAEWAEKGVNETYPYPGKECYDRNDCLLTVEGEVNIDEENKYKLWVPASDDPKSGMKNTGTKLKAVSLNKLTVMA